MKKTDQPIPYALATEPPAEAPADPAKKARKGRRGFASMSPAKQRAIASMGGKAAQALGKAHKFTSEEAREAGRKGGLAASTGEAKGHRFTPEEARAAGRRGGLMASARKAQLRAEAKADKAEQGGSKP